MSFGGGYGMGTGGRNAVSGGSQYNNNREEASAQSHRGSDEQAGARQTQMDDHYEYQPPKVYKETRLARTWNERFNPYERPFPVVPMHCWYVPGPNEGSAGRFCSIGSTPIKKDGTGGSESIFCCSAMYYDKENQCIRRCPTSGRGHVKQMAKGSFELNVDECKMMVKLMLQFLLTNGVSVDDATAVNTDDWLNA